MTKVNSIEGLWDDQVTRYDYGEVCRRPARWFWRILHRVFRMPHRWETFFNVRSEGSSVVYASSYTRACSRCGEMDCYHSFDREEEFLIGDDLVQTIFKVAWCRHCKRRVKTSSSIRHTPTPEALALISEVNNVKYSLGGYDRDFYTEFPVEVSRRLRGGCTPEEVRGYIQRTLGLPEDCPDRVMRSSEEDDLWLDDR